MLISKSAFKHKLALTCIYEKVGIMAITIHNYD